MAGRKRADKKRTTLIMVVLVGCMFPELHAAEGFVEVVGRGG